MKQLPPDVRQHVEMFVRAISEDAKAAAKAAAEKRTHFSNTTSATQHLMAALQSVLKASDSH